MTDPEAEGMRVAAIRGAVQAENDADGILSATEELIREIISVNDLEPDRMISAIFTTTEDLDAEFPAAAARRMGLNEVPLMCAREIPVPGAMPGVIRVMLHTYLPAGAKARHVYLGETRNLRADLDAAQ
ncbi:MAG TPA: chorismate mutase [Solirubrobacterales bacterium]|nr:chorismate mutase [Solirubrobacterales bacterium]HMX71644.1 chorismate mutase [Solirubrobacterales bacterium]HMY25866.1 chorismate mutase [Solirubrobacterales bacterium]HNA23520.1 chorismate mutase [Solirubrobacterales bacterium]HNC06876.1 chorismate mutase [Solirubrobacterales bacterium]